MSKELETIQQAVISAYSTISDAIDEVLATLSLQEAKLEAQQQASAEVFRVVSVTCACGRRTQISQDSEAQ